MLVCYELGKTEEEVSKWHIEDVMRWVAFFKLKNEAEAKALKEQQAAAARRGNGQVTKY